MDTACPCNYPSPPMTTQHPPQNAALVTDQCTDQCIVITCHDPDHVDGISCDSLYRTELPTYLPPSSSYPATSPCPGDTVCLGQPVLQVGQGLGCGIECNSAYTGPSECADCVSPYFDDFCCSDSYPDMPAERSSPAFLAHLNATSIFWDQVSMESNPCPLCGQDRSLCTSNCHCQDSLEQPLLPFSPASQATGEERQTVLSTAEAITCQWGNCQASFSTPAELVGHVNMHHLYSSPSSTSIQIETEQPDSPSRRSPPTGSIQPLEGISTDASQLSCQWRNCSKDPPPPPHLCPLPYELWRDLIAVHVFKDHLGLPPDIISPAVLEFARTYKGDGPMEPPPSVDTTPSLSPSLSSMTEPVDAVPGISLRATPSEMNADMRVSIKQPAALLHQCRWRECNESFESCEELTVHLSKVHIGTGRPIYECFWEGCARNGEAGFGSRQKINRHLQSHTGHRPFQCRVCHQNFSEAATLQQHMRRHTQEKPYACDHPGCGKSFAIAGALTIHKRMHSGQRPFKCPHCDRAFAESSNLSKHLRTHTGVKPYTCSEPGCCKSFARPDQLSRHLATHRKRARPPDVVISI